MPNWNQKTKTHKIKFPFCQGQTKTPGGFYTWPPIHGIICLFVPDFPTAMVEILEVRVPSPRDQVSRYLPKWKGHHRIDPCLTLGNLRFFSKKKMRGCYCIYISWWDGNTRYTNISYISCIYISIIYKKLLFFWGGGALLQASISCSWIPVTRIQAGQNFNRCWPIGSRNTSCLPWKGLSRHLQLCGRLFPNFYMWNCVSNLEGELSKKWNQDMEILGLYPLILDNASIQHYVYTAFIYTLYTYIQRWA